MVRGLRRACASAPVAGVLPCPCRGRSCVIACQSNPTEISPGLPASPAREDLELRVKVLARMLYDGLRRSSRSTSRTWTCATGARRFSRPSSTTAYSKPSSSDSSCLTRPPASPSTGFPYRARCGEIGRGTAKAVTRGSTLRASGVYSPASQYMTMRYVTPPLSASSRGTNPSWSRRNLSSRGRWSADAWHAGRESQ
jgi:hypothetical protein